MKKNNFYYFKRALLLSLPIAVFIIISELFDIELSDSNAVIKAFAKGFFVGVLTGVILGILNIFAKIDTFLKKE
ncbi:hypothetical protein SAMN04515667_2127 [Formosa sp. Hel1_31_208]|uniref:hypothetical protein n=1 Tax=Formosa sp. Hel1_31_208 TaxID=1798225 RepID=UPI00087A2BDA|nr:hypothetical protein [Formosa sp. Hel1_31_208]SDS41549.1 hypothetical protein SAMN04515667_2127 [Formosa sp. Hel1_31_208]